MSFTTKKYTRPVLRAELKKLKADNFVSFNEFVSAFSPRARSRSAKLAALKSAIPGGNGQIRTVFNFSSGNAAKRQLLDLLNS